MMNPNTPWKVSNRKIRVGLVGCGRISKNHFEAIQYHASHLELVGVCDSNQQAALKAMQEYGVEGFENLHGLLATADPDLVVLCTPSGLHPSQTIQAAKAGKHVLTEKPMATRWTDGLEMLKACDEANVHLMVVKQNRLNKTVQLLKQAIDNGRFGRIYMVNSNVFWTRPQEYYDQGGWRGTWEWDGGAYMNQASHYVDLMQWLIGPIASVQAMMGTLQRNIATEDSGILNIRWRNGALGSMNVTMLTWPKNYEGSITIIGEKGTVRLGGIALNEIEHWEFAEKLPADEEIQSANYQTDSVYGSGHMHYYENVIQTLQGNSQPLVSGRDGLHSLELLMAAYRAARDGNTVSLPLEI